MSHESMAIGSVESFEWNTLSETKVHPGISRWKFETERVGIVRYAFEPGAVFPRHSHPEWQVTIVVSGTMTFDFGDRIDHYGPDSIVSIPGGVPHEGRAEHGPVTITCIFSPPRP